MLFHVE
jgi:glutathione S-transferase